MPEFTSGVEPIPNESRVDIRNVQLHGRRRGGGHWRSDKQTARCVFWKATACRGAGKGEFNPGLVRGQKSFGGVLQGLARLVTKTSVFDLKGKLVNPNFTDYRFPTALDMPDEVVPIHLELRSRMGPFGARGLPKPPHDNQPPHDRERGGRRARSADEDVCRLRRRKWPGVKWGFRTTT